MKDASDLRSKAKDKRRMRREHKMMGKDPDRMNFRSEKEYKRHEAHESDEEDRMEMMAWKIGKRK